MASLIQEYRQRHGMNFVMPLDEGLCFFDRAKKPDAIVITSSHSRHMTTCRRCLSNKGSLVGEIVVHSGLSFPSDTYNIVKHEHISPDLDLRQWVNDVLPGNHEPVVVTDDRHIECWLWRFFIRYTPAYVRKWSSKEEPYRSIEQMMWTIQNKNSTQTNRRMFEAFYKNIYYNFVLGRKYLLYG